MNANDVDIATLVRLQSLILEELRELRGRMPLSSTAASTASSPEGPPGRASVEAEPRHEQSAVKGMGQARSKSQAKWDSFYGPILPIVLDMRGQGINNSDIARQLNDSGHRTIYGQPYFPATVGAILLRASSAGSRLDP